MEKILAASGFAADRCGNQLVTPARSARRLQPLRFDVRGSSCLSILPIFELNLWINYLRLKSLENFSAGSLEPNVRRTSAHLKTPAILEVPRRVSQAPKKWRYSR